MAKIRPKKIGDMDVRKDGIKCEEDEKRGSMVKIGKEAPDFELSAYHNGEFKTVKLSDYRGKWVLLCFYPGDFTFV